MLKLVHQVDDALFHLRNSAHAVDFVIDALFLVYFDKGLCLGVIGADAVGDGLVVGIVGTALDQCSALDTLLDDLVRLLHEPKTIRKTHKIPRIFIFFAIVRLIIFSSRTMSK